MSIQQDFQSRNSRYRREFSLDRVGSMSLLTRRVDHRGFEERARQIVRFSRWQTAISTSRCRYTLTDRFINLIFHEVIVIFPWPGSWSGYATALHSTAPDPLSFSWQRKQRPRGRLGDDQCISNRAIYGYLYARHCPRDSVLWIKKQKRFERRREVFSTEDLIFFN